MRTQTAEEQANDLMRKNVKAHVEKAIDKLHLQFRALMGAERGIEHADGRCGVNYVVSICDQIEHSMGMLSSKLRDELEEVDRITDEMVEENRSRGR